MLLKRILSLLISALSDIVINGFHDDAVLAPPHSGGHPVWLFYLGLHTFQVLIIQLVIHVEVLSVINLPHLAPLGLRSARGSFTLVERVLLRHHLVALHYTWAPFSWVQSLEVRLICRVSGLQPADALEWGNEL